MRIMAKDLFTKCRRVEKRIDAKIEERARSRALGERVTASYSSEPRGGSGPTSKVEIGRRFTPLPFCRAKVRPAH